MQLFACPFETRRCGRQPRLAVPSSGQKKTIQDRDFNKDDACYYWIEAEGSGGGAVSNGDFVYVHFTAMSEVTTFVSIKTDFNAEDV